MLDCWEIANALYRPGDRVTLDELPSRTSIRFSGRMPPETRPEDIGVKFTGRRRKKKAAE